MRDIVNGLLIKGGNVLLAHRAKTRKSYAGTWSFPGGHVEAGEKLEDGLTRELMEEIGVQPLSWAPLHEFCLIADNARFHFFAVTEWRGEVTNLGHEHSELQWVDLHVADRMENLTFPIYAEIFASLARKS